MTDETLPHFDTTPSIINGHAPQKSDIKYTIGPYHIINEIGKGGMGEVLLAYDTTCGRRVALKKIRPDLLEHKNLHNRFLKEARITSQLTHPAIMPIYVIQNDDKITYYTMPYVEGQTLKRVLKNTAEQQKKGEQLDHVGGSIPALIRIFLTICQAIAYAHSHKVLHRDIKPENIMIGEYGEVLILDWGLAKLIRSNNLNSNSIQTNQTLPSDQTNQTPPNNQTNHPLINSQTDNTDETDHTLTIDPSPHTENKFTPSNLPEHHNITRPGKVVGTLSYMAPERGKGEPATIQTEIYALGVTLFQMLTLKPPFHRKDLSEFRKKMDKEVVPDPIQIAPYRDIPKVLSQICLKCLEKDPSNRYQTVDELIRELENYIEGRAEWFHIADLNIKERKDWEFQENILITEHIAITRGTDHTDWVSLMISKESFSENVKIETTVTIGEKGDGIGFLLSIPEAAERSHLNDGYCLWLGSDLNKTTKLLRSTVEVVNAPEIFLQRHLSYHIRIEKIDQNIYFYLNNILQFTYISHLPLTGTHIGFLSRDGDFTMSPISVNVGSQNVMVNCLAVPDAFLAHKDYTTALNEYRRIGYSFPGRAEGREAMFRAGITILEQAKSTKDTAEKNLLYETAMNEFEKLHNTPGAPLEYLGKAHVYQAMQDPDEEIKCYELGMRRYTKHPLLPIIHEQLIYRMHEVSRTHRRATYQFMLTALKHLPESTISIHTKRLFSSLQKHWEPLDFIQKDPECTKSESLQRKHFGIQLAFWANNPLAILEFIDTLVSNTPPPMISLANAIFCLIEMEHYSLAKNKLDTLDDKIRFSRELKLTSIAIEAHEEGTEAALRNFKEIRNPILSWDDARLLIHLAQLAIDQNIPSFVHQLPIKDLSPTIQKTFDSYQIWAYLLESEWDKASEIFQKYTYNDLTDENSLLYLLYGCYIAATESKELAEAHFSGSLETTFPRMTTLLSHYIKGRLHEGSSWQKQAFAWEKKQLARQIALYAHCSC